MKKLEAERQRLAKEAAKDSEKSQVLASCGFASAHRTGLHCRRLTRKPGQRSNRRGLKSVVEPSQAFQLSRRHEESGAPKDLPFSGWGWGAVRLFFLNACTPFRPSRCKEAGPSRRQAPRERHRRGLAQCGVETLAKANLRRKAPGSLRPPPAQSSGKLGRGQSSQRARQRPCAGGKVAAGFEIIYIFFYIYLFIIIIIIMINRIMLYSYYVIIIFKMLWQGSCARNLHIL